MSGHRVYLVKALGIKAEKMHFSAPRVSAKVPNTSGELIALL